MSKKKSLKRRLPRFVLRSKIGASPGEFVDTGAGVQGVVRLITYGQGACVEQTIKDISQLQQLTQDTTKIHWVDVIGVEDSRLLRKVGETFKLHKLVVEDISNTDQRAKVDTYQDWDYFILRMPIENQSRYTEQISIVLQKNVIITFQEVHRDPLEPIRERLRLKSGRLYQLPAGYLAYNIVDIVIDSYFPVLEGFAEQLDQIEDNILLNANFKAVEAIHSLKKDLIYYRRVISAHRDLLSNLLRAPSGNFTEDILIYARDSYDHVAQQIDLAEGYKDVGSNLMDLSLNLSNQKSNEVMKVLTVIASIFIPLTFIVGIYGMNFDTTTSVWSMPELSHPYGYPIVMGVMFMLSVLMLLFFRRKKWI